MAVVEKILITSSTQPFLPCWDQFATGFMCITHSHFDTFGSAIGQNHGVCDTKTFIRG